MEEYGLPAYDAMVITGSKALADYFDQCVEKFSDAKTVSNWIMGELLRLLNAHNLEVEDSPVKPEGLAELLALINKGTISGKIAKTVFEEMFETGKGAEEIVKEKGLVQITDEKVLAPIVDKVIEENPKSVEDYRNGKDRAFGFLVGQVMKATKGKANPQLVNKLLRERL